MKQRFLVTAATFGLVTAALAACGSEADLAETSAATGAGGTGGGASSTGGGGDATTSTTSTTTTTTTTTTSTGAGGAPPGRCEPFATTGAVLAMSKLLLGDTNPDGGPNPASGWKQYGFDLDGLTSTAASNDVCLPSSGGAPQSVYPDGDNGIDNAFGKNVLPIFLGLAPDIGGTVNASIQQGDFTLILHLKDATILPTQGPIAARLYTGAPTASTPLFNGTDCWPTNPNSLSNPTDIDAANIVFPTSTLTTNAWLSGITDKVVLDIPVVGATLSLTIHEARFSMLLDAAHETATLGQLGGVLDTEELIVELTKIAGTFDPSLCSGSTIDSIANQMRQASDILLDGTQDPTKTCNAVSIGLGFEMARVELGTIAEALPPPFDPCQ